MSAPDFNYKHVKKYKKEIDIQKLAPKNSQHLAAKIPQVGPFDDY
jgi:hypothetical protein